MTKTQAVWITGVGTANPLGNDYQSSARNLLDGQSGIAPVTDFTMPEHLSNIAGRLGTIPRPSCCDVEEFQAHAALPKLMLWCCAQALESAGLGDFREEQRIGLSLGLGAEWLFAWEHGKTQCGLDVNCIGGEHDESVVELVGRKLHLTGPAATVAAACASANYAFEQARQWIRQGWCDVCLAGGGETFISALAMACFGNLRALSRRNDDPTQASRPFDRDRDGFVMSEGGVVFVLESEAHARQRGAVPLAEVAGFGASSDAFHMVIPSPEPNPAVLAMRQALRDAQISPEEVDYVNAHATSTPVGDPAECKVLAKVLGCALARTPVSSTKSMTGHLLSGAAAMNALACLVALENQAVPPTINLDEPDPECPLNHVPHQAQPRNIRVAVSNSLGFGGSNTTVVLRKAG